MSEPVSVLPTGSPAGGYILRTLPQNTNQTIMLPVFSLISRRDANEPWIEELFRYSGYKSKKEFVLNEFVLPLVDLHILFSIQNGLTTEFHQQNVMIKVNKDTRKIEGLVIKDMDSHFIDQSLRKNALGISTNDLPITQEMSYLFRFKMAQDNQIKSYMDIMRTRSFEWVLKYVLNSKDLESILREADTRYLTAFNHQFPEFSVSRMSEVKTAWDRVHQKYTTADEADVYRRMNEADTKKNRGFIIESIDKVQSKLSERRFSNVPVARLSCAHFYLSF
ncbi:MAG: hypothetical protein JNL11_00130 [Bdellovibrionaceae bacterium]|nr:hypothetical protein [Pseudobdellovibrionaceae bacterium]